VLFEGSDAAYRKKTVEISKSDNRITVIGETNFRHYHMRFGIKRPDRMAHMYLLGQTGSGKSTLIANFALQDAANGEGFALIDPHGDLVSKVRELLPEKRLNDLVYLNVPDRTQSLAFNPLAVGDPHLRPLVASGLISILKKIWPESWGPRMEYILRNVLLALLDVPESTLLDVPRLLDDADFRTRALSFVHDPQVRRFWIKEYESYPRNFRAEAIAPIQNKIGEFLVNPILRRIVGHAKSSFDLRQVMDEGKILLVNLAKGSIGEDSASLLGGMLVTTFSLAALSRSTVPEHERRPFFLYLDEFPSFTTASIGSLLSEMRKYRLGLILAHQYLLQVDETVRDAILGNAGTVIAFRTGLTDALLLEKEFFPEFNAHDLIRLPNYHVYVRLMIDGVKSRAFSARTLPMS